MRMKSLLNGNVWLWDRGKFMNRRFLMQVIPDSGQSASSNLFIMGGFYLNVCEILGSLKRD